MEKTGWGIQELYSLQYFYKTNKIYFYKSKELVSLLHVFNKWENP